MTKEVSQDQSERMAKISSVSDLVASSSEVAHCDQLSTLLLTLRFNGCVEKKKKVKCIRLTGSLWGVLANLLLLWL